MAVPPATTNFRFAVLLDPSRGYACACACSREREREKRGGGRGGGLKTGAVGRRTLTRSRCCPLCSHRCFLSRNALSNFLPFPPSSTPNHRHPSSRLAVSSACAIRFTTLSISVRLFLYIYPSVRKPLFGYPRGEFPYTGNSGNAILSYDVAK